MAKLIKSIKNKQIETSFPVSILHVPFKGKFVVPNVSSFWRKELNIEELAWSVGFYIKKPKKITATALVKGFLHMKTTGDNTLKDWAIHAGIENNSSISKQSLNERLNEKSCLLGKTILQKVLTNEIDWRENMSENEVKRMEKMLRFFPRVLIHDSTCQAVSTNLEEEFSSSFSRGNPSATVRIQAVYEMIGNQWLEFSVDSYRQNDQSQSDLIIPLVQKGDLILRDLGYFVLNVLEQLIKDQFVITKWDNKTYLFDRRGRRLHFSQLFKRKKQIDMPVLVGSKKRLKMRLVARKLPTKVAKKRIAEAKQDRHSKANHSEEYYENLKWEVYLTNVTSNRLNAKQITQVYGLRWYIEILFKSWKSHFNFKDMFKLKKLKFHRVLFTIYLLLIQIVLYGDLFKYMEFKVFESTGKSISIFKFFDVANKLTNFILHMSKITDIDCHLPQFAQHATYENRTDRQNMKEKILIFKELCV